MEKHGNQGRKLSVDELKAMARKKPKDKGVFCYGIADEWIIVLFHDGWGYFYTYESAGQEKVEKMKEHAQAGEGLTRFIRENVYEKYALKFAWKEYASAKHSQD